MKTLISFLFAMAVAVGAIGVSSNAAQAAVTWTWDDTTDTLSGAQGVIIGTGIYSVSFVTGSCVDIFSGCNEASDFAFADQPSAEAAAEALLAQVFIDGSGEPGNSLFDTDPELTQGCTTIAQCEVRIPYGVPAAAVAFWQATNSSGGDSDSGGNVLIGTALDDQRTWAVFTQTGVVPIPPALLLFLSGLVAFFGVARSGRRQAKAEA